MSKLYVGNLPSEADEKNIRELFSDHGLTTSSVLLKKGGYAFVDCAEPTDVEAAVNIMNGRLFIRFIYWQ